MPSLMYTGASNPHSNDKDGIIISVLQVRKLRHKDVRKRAQI